MVIKCLAFLKKKSNSPTDLSQRQKQLRAPNYSTVLAQLMIITQARPEHPVCILTAAGHGQSPQPTLPSSLSPTSNVQSQAADSLPAALHFCREVPMATSRGASRLTESTLCWLVCRSPTSSSPQGLFLGWHSPSSLTRSRVPGNTS